VLASDVQGDTDVCNNIPFVQTGTEASYTGAESVKLDPRCSWESHYVWVLVSGIKVRSLTHSVVQTLCIPLLVHPARCMYVVVDHLMSCCAVGTNKCLDLKCCAFTPGGRVSVEWSMCPTVQVPLHSVLETVRLLCDEAQQVGCLRGWEGCPLVCDAGIQAQFARRR